MTPGTDDTVLSIATLLELIRKAGAVTSQPAFDFMVVNETRQLLPYRQAILWSTRERGGTIQAVSGHPQPDPDAPFMQWLTALLRETMDKAIREGSLHIHREDLSANLAADWSNHLPTHGLLLPLGPARGPCMGGLLLARETPWHREDTLLLGDLVAVYGLSWYRITAGTDPWRGRWMAWLHRNRRRALALLLLPILFIPVRQSVLAPAEVVPERPIILRAPMKGIVDRFLVTPNQEVHRGDPLLALDDKELKNRLEIARREHDVAVAEFRQAEQKAVHGHETAPMASMLGLKVRQRLTEVAFLEEKLNTVLITAPKDGVVIFANPDDWIGRPVAQGERLFMLADPTHVALAIQLAVTDAIPLDPGAEISLFLNGRPTEPLQATLSQISYQATPTPEGTLAYQLKGTFDRATPFARIGFRGSARIYHGRVTLGGYLGRKPWILVRQWLGL
ncbi:MAG: HlyD family efflux transporter periplasmic adaptor subunit [Magnetococcales bacterium]|nr:HlyD family efflux transporter periplasmic adaptor subunit [Magnetococcales bacterium]MBF0150674.1 HlyD family efflux transporter periplasmic adaptor subunit [Magnetococcales bacterium]MBF0173438.1 HlyD family efflux transporter periplasmic adaptor subunit [Magnetococcales bacterium]MBF0346330.1 HlyD family efflux transporter periplasmic adaptor subunit [Magnetococcales bacterium]MBF0631633.1 HlyD family efflux transporter periplasmic adaptor subunit [Magnetococcales bacterium]